MLRNYLSGLLFLTFILCSQAIDAQSSNDDCINAQSLCPNTSFAGSTAGAGNSVCAGCEDGATTAGNFCFAPNNTIWFSFTTNSTGGNATINFTNISCLIAAGFDDQLQAVVIDATTPCDESTYSSVSNCEPGANNDFSLNAIGLQPNTTYYVQVNGDLSGAGITNAAECDFTIEATGPAVDPVISISSTPSDCGVNDGTVTINSVDGGQSPYSYSIDGSAFQSGNAFSNLSGGIHEIIIQDNNGCLFFEEENVMQTNGPQNSSANITPASCTGNDGQIQIVNTTGGNPAYTYTMVGGGTQSSNTFSNFPAGSYVIIVTDQQSCTDTVIAVISNSNGITDATAVITPSDCGASTGEIIVNVNGGSAPYQYSLNGGTGQTSNTYSGLSAGSYDIIITDASGCTFLLSSVIIDENPPDQSPTVTVSQSPSPACEGEPVDFTATVTNGGASTNYEFFVNGSSVQNGGSAIYSTSSFTTGDIITCTVTSNDACVAINNATSNQITVTVVTPFTPTTTISSPVTSACAGDPVTVIATSDCTTGGTYTWVVNGTSVSTSTSDTASLILTADSQISVIYNCNESCAQPSTSNTISIPVTEIIADAGPDQMIAPGESTILLGSGTSGATYTWTPATALSDPTIAQPTATPNATTTYLLTVSLNGCTATDDVIIVVSVLILPPNTFTPNGDNANDLWEILRIEEYPNCKVTVYDRWGQKVYNTVGYTNSNGWNGTNNGLKLPASTYFYVIDLNQGGGDSDIYAGSVTIIY